jgi:hypothetical protein
LCLVQNVLVVVMVQYASYEQTCLTFIEHRSVEKYKYKYKFTPFYLVRTKAVVFFSCLVTSLLVQYVLNDSTLWSLPVCKFRYIFLLLGEMNS